MGVESDFGEVRYLHIMLKNNWNPEKHDSFFTDKR